MSRRTERIGELIRGELARLLRSQVADPRLGLLTLTRVDVAPDLRRALVLWSCLDVESGSQDDQIEAGLASAAPYLRRRLATALVLKRTPELCFQRDPSLERGEHTLAVLRTLGDEPG